MELMIGEALYNIHLCLVGNTSPRKSRSMYSCIKDEVGRLDHSLGVMVRTNLAVMPRPASSPLVPTATQPPRGKDS